jgi:tetratricopeptide (TPR) repeat protein
MSMRLRAAGALLAAGLLLAPARAEERIRYREGGKPTSVTGVLEKESVGGLVVKPNVGKDKKTIAVGDVIDVVYDMPAKVRLGGLNATLDAEDKGQLDKALEGYKTMLPDLADAKYAPAKRHVEYKVAALTATIAEQKGQELNLAAETLAEFMKHHKDAWQVVPAGKQLGRIQMTREKFDEAGKVFEDLAKLDGLTEATKQELELFSIDALIRAGKAGDAEKRLEAAVKSLAADDPQRPRLQVYLIGCKAGNADAKAAEAAEKELQTVIRGTADPKLKALAFNTLGDCYVAAQRLDDAKFAYLMVDVVLNQDAGEHAKAVERLSKVFRELKDDQRADDYKAKLLKIR